MFEGEVIVLANPIEASKKEDESFENLLRRFNRRIQQSGNLARARKIRFFERPKNKRAIRESAARRKKSREYREHLKKIGRI